MSPFTFNSYAADASVLIPIALDTVISVAAIAATLNVFAIEILPVPPPSRFTFIALRFAIVATPM